MLAEVFRQRPGTEVSGPPGRQVGAAGRLPAEVSWDNYFALILRAFLAAGRARRGRIGGADAEPLESGPLVAFRVRSG